MNHYSKCLLWGERWIMCVSLLLLLLLHWTVFIWLLLLKCVLNFSISFRTGHHHHPAFVCTGIHIKCYRPTCFYFSVQKNTTTTMLLLFVDEMWYITHAEWQILGKSIPHNHLIIESEFFSSVNSTLIPHPWLSLRAHSSCMWLKLNRFVFVMCLQLVDCRSIDWLAPCCHHSTTMRHIQYIVFTWRVLLNERLVSLACRAVASASHERNAVFGTDYRCSRFEQSMRICTYANCCRCRSWWRRSCADTGLFWSGPWNWAEIGTHGKNRDEKLDLNMFVGQKLWQTMLRQFVTIFGQIVTNKQKCCRFAHLNGSIGQVHNNGACGTEPCMQMWNTWKWIANTASWITASLHQMLRHVALEIDD